MALPETAFICGVCRACDKAGLTHPGVMHLPSICDCECHDEGGGVMEYPIGQLIEPMAEAFYKEDDTYPEKWEHQTDDVRNWYRRMTRAALAPLVEKGWTVEAEDQGPYATLPFMELEPGNYLVVGPLDKEGE